VTEKVDLRAERRDLYSPEPGVFTVMQVPAFRFLAVDGHGDPETSPAYRTSVAALYAAGYAAKALSRTQLARDYVVLPLEGLWRSEGHDFSDRRAWDWTMMIRQPEWLDRALLIEAIRRAASKGHAQVDMRVTDYDEGLSVQTLHVGGYDDEAPTIARLHEEFLPSQRLVESGDHHEIYLSDPRRVAPEKLKTILRQPVRPKA